MKTLRLALALPLVAWLAAGCGSYSASSVEEDGSTPTVGEEEDEDEDEAVPVGDVPQAAIDAALAAVPGFVIEEAELESEGVFELDGHVNGVPTEVEVDAEGNVIEVDSGDDEDDDEEEDEEGHAGHDED